MCGDINGLQTTTIDFEYSPKTYSTAEMEISIRTSEFDSQPCIVRIVGSAQPNLLKQPDRDAYVAVDADERTKTLLMNGTRAK